MKLTAFNILFRPSVLNNPDKPVDMGVQADLAINILKEMFVEHGSKCYFYVADCYIFPLMQFALRNPQSSMSAASQALHRRSRRKSTEDDHATLWQFRKRKIRYTMDKPTRSLISNGIFRSTEKPNPRRNYKKRF